MGKRQEKMQSLMNYMADKLPKEYDYMYIGLYGSQNYNLDHKHSDYDFVAVVMPTLKDLIKNKTISVQFEIEGIGHVLIKDIRLVFKELTKGNLTYYEIFCTDFYSTTMKYKESMEHIRLLIEPLARLNENNIFRTVKGMMKGIYTIREKKTEKNKEEIKEYGYCAKNIISIIRLSDFIQAYFRDNKPLKDSLKVNESFEENAKYILKHEISKECIDYNIEWSVSEVKDIEIERNTKKFNNQYNIPEMMLDSILRQLIEEALRGELYIK